MNNAQEVQLGEDTVTLNCTIAYIRYCWPTEECKIACASIGAKSFRWFKDGCCECVGDNCMKYGIDESR